LVRNYWNNDLPLIKIISIAPWISIILIFFLTANFTSRFIWKVASMADKSLFPDINGTWSGEIIFAEGKFIPAKLLIRQTIFQTLIDIHTETSKSITLESTPSVEGGQCKIYYSYRSIPKNTQWSTYIGTTIFDVRRVYLNKNSILELSGQYFTDRGSKGRVRFQQISKDIYSDVSFY
ncbi:MAG: hypothetical protein RLZZ237_4031, partial [Pseudomonadota bacterium]|jgi:hypothetical protein